jgi:deoxyribose-phosphate aldolase
MEYPRLARLFDHSILRPDATMEEVARYAETAARLGTATLTVQPHYIRFAVDQLAGSDVPVGTVVGFPHGNETTATKVYQTQEAIALGAAEIDVVMSIPLLKQRDKSRFVREIESVVRAADGRVVKVITENCYLTDDEKRCACHWIADAGAHFVKTSTGFAPGGATVADVRLMHDAVAGRCQVKASGGIQSIEVVLSCLEAGARRIGSSRTEEILRAFDELPVELKAAVSALTPLFA